MHDVCETCSQVVARTSRGLQRQGRSALQFGARGASWHSHVQRTLQTSGNILSVSIVRLRRSCATCHETCLGDAKHVTDHQASGSDPDETAAGKCREPIPQYA